jgi:gliding motility-associated-like protein
MKRIIKYFLIPIFICLSHINGYSQIDTSFWFAAPDLQGDQPGGLHGDKPIYLRIAASKQAANVFISIPANPSFNTIAVAVAANSSISVDLTAYISQVENGTVNTVSQKGLLIQSDAPISCYYDIANRVNGDMYALKGKNALGKKFTVPFQMDFANAIRWPTTNDFIIVATENNTTVTITSKKPLVGIAANQAHVIKLNKGETYVCRGASIIGSEKPGGTIVLSDKPIAISTKDDSIEYPGALCADTAGDQIIPDSIAGKEFIVIKGYFTNSPDYYFVFATEDGTTVKLNGVAQKTMNAGEYFTGRLTDLSCYVETDKPSHLFHISGFGCEAGGAVIPSLKCTGSGEVSVTRADLAGQFYINVLSKKEHINDFTLNGGTTLIESSTFLPVSGTSGDWMFTRIPIHSSILNTTYNFKVENKIGKFHVGVIQGSSSSTARYGYFSDFGSNIINLDDENSKTSIFSANKLICHNTPAIITATNKEAKSFTWTGPNGFLSNGPQLSINNFSATNDGDYTITSTSDGCGTASKTLKLESQKPIAEFTSIQTGCVQDSVYITTGKYDAVRWIWDLGNGVKIDTNKIDIKPIKYNTAGDYIIKMKLVTSIGCIAEESSKTISITPKPVANFSMPSSICVDQDITFTDASTIESGTISKWFWSLNDGSGIISANNNNPKTTRYQQYGLKNIGLLVASNSGCKSDTFFINPKLIVNPKPEIGFIIPEVCLEDANAVFIDTTRAADGATNFLYQWNFNAGSSPVSPGPTFTNADISKQNPSIKYNIAGSYQVSLTASSKGCSNSLTSNFTVNGSNPVPGFDIIQPNSLCSNDSVRIQNTSTVYPGNVSRIEIYWDANDLSQKTIDENPEINKIYAFRYKDFQSPGSKPYTIKLVAYSGSALSCSKFISKNITVNASPKVTFSNIPGICFDAAPKQLTETSFDPRVAGTFIYSGDGVDASGLFNPALAGVGLHAIKFMYTSSVGACKDSASSNIFVWSKPMADFNFSTLNCEKNTIIFTSKSSTVTGKVIKYNWDFNDGSAIRNISNADTAHHIFKASNLFNVRLRVQTDSGCFSDQKVLPITIHPLPIIKFDLPKVCLPVGKAVFMNNTSIADGTTSLLTYLWNFGDANDVSPSVLKDGQHNFKALGKYNVKLIATSTNNCKDSLTQQLVDVFSQPKARFSSEDSLCILDIAHFKDESTVSDGIIDKWFWNFGDNKTDISKNPNHQYTNSGSNTVVFYAQTVDGCYSDTIQKIINIYDYPKISAGPDLRIITDGRKPIQAIASGNIIRYIWTPSTYLSRIDTLQPYVIRPQEDITYYVEAIGRGKCSSFDSMNVVAIFMPTPPNTFTPNRDGINDVWEIKYLDQYPGCVIEVFTSTGKLIYQNYNYTKPWDGKYNGNYMPAGTYYFVIDPKNGRQKFAGFVTILK